LPLESFGELSVFNGEERTDCRRLFPPYNFCYKIYPFMGWQTALNRLGCNNSEAKMPQAILSSVMSASPWKARSESIMKRLPLISATVLAWIALAATWLCYADLVVLQRLGALFYQ
jgi:hypothetical protein